MTGSTSAGATDQLRRLLNIGSARHTMLARSWPTCPAGPCQPCHVTPATGDVRPAPHSIA
ncbi:hypothetical protein [Actinacidiphila oryziradicis]|uniref:Uncharacterized protein n=1 Tax=Actinacidiphila oryziradicis TaxID=2571141 RepID=A0A4U0RZQ4_9ACTN|nr:hypothetical protein [Actinacidiphila oryziradicis]TKA01942.1 hypothetical protein FCI23_39850 [Actinacidiphila oryziradicis]